MDSFFHFIHFLRKFIFLASCDFVMMVTTICQRYLEIQFGFFKSFFVGVKFGGKSFEETYTWLCYFLHFVVILFHIGDTVCYENFRLLFSAVCSWSNSFF